MAKISNKTVYIYGLVDPVSNKIRYVGKSIDPESRLKQHIKDQSHVYRTCWIHSLLERGLKPTYIILEMVKPGNDWEVRERYWIVKGYEEGWRLTNLTSGGDGLRDPSPETRAKMSKSQRERPPPNKETLAKRSAALKGRTRTEGWKKKISDSLVGHPVSEYTRQMLSMANKGKKCTVAAIAKSSKAMKALWADPNSIFNSKEFRDKQAASHMGHPVSLETRQRISESHHNMSPEAKAEKSRKQSEAKKGKKRGPIPDETKRKISKSQKGKTLTEEHKQKLRVANLGKKHSEKTKHQMSKSHKGKVFSEEHKRKLRGENNASSKLTSKEVLEIRRLLCIGQISKNELAAIFGVSSGTIYDIYSFRTWKHLGEGYEKNQDH